MGSATLTELQALLNAFTAYYNTRRPHRSLPYRAAPPPPATHGPRPLPATAPLTPATASAPTAPTPPAKSPRATAEKLYHIGIGRAHGGTRVLLLAQDLHIRVTSAATGELPRELTLDPDRNYQPTGAPRRRPIHQTQ